MLKPLNDRIIVLPNAAKEATEGGLIIPDGAQEKPSKGVVVAVGIGKHEQGVLIPMQLIEGDIVLYNKFAGQEVDIDGVIHLIMREFDVFAVEE